MSLLPIKIPPRLETINTYHWVFALCLVAYSGLFLLSLDAFRISPLVWTSTAFVVGSAIFYTYFFNSPETGVSAKFVLLGAVLFHGLGILGEPFLEDDYYRYLWDGYRFFESGTPYGKAPEEFFSVSNVPEKFQRILDQINYPWVPTIYGPVLQYLFLLNHLVFPGDVNGLQILFSAINLVFIGILLRHAKPAAVLLYAWNPLVIKEIAFTAHPDGVVAALVFAAVISLFSRKRTLAATILALALAAKVVAVLFVPFLLLYSRPKHWLIFVLVLLALYLPFMAPNGSELGGLSAFAQQWEFNPALYRIAKHIIPGDGARLAMALIYILGYACYLLTYLKQTKHPLMSLGRGEPQRFQANLPIPRGDWIFMGLLLVSPVINAWYLIWLLPFSVLYPRRWSWGFSILVSLSYLVGLHFDDVHSDRYELPAWVPVLEYGGLVLLIAFSTRSRKRQFAATDPTPIIRR